MKKRKARATIEFVTDPAVRYEQAVRLYPNAKVRVRQVAPVQDDGMPPLPVAHLSDYKALIEYVRDNCNWNGDAAEFKWVVATADNPVLATGNFKFAPDRTVSVSETSLRKLLNERDHLQRQVTSLQARLTQELELKRRGSRG